MVVHMELIEKQTVKEFMIKYGFKAPDMTVTEFVEDVLPSAQSVATEMNVGDKKGDTIYRQAAIDAMCWACGNDCDKSEFVYNAPQYEQVIICPEHYALSTLPSAQQETARRIVGKSMGGMTLWYQCDMCNVPIDKQDVYCRGCGRRFVNG